MEWQDKLDRASALVKQLQATLKAGEAQVRCHISHALPQSLQLLSSSQMHGQLAPVM